VVEATLCGYFGGWKPPLRGGIAGFHIAMLFIFAKRVTAIRRCGEPQKRHNCQRFVNCTDLVQWD
jgi:hypothetical protein